MMRICRLLFALCLFTLQGIFLPAQNLTVSPGLTITSGTLPWALDAFHGNRQLVPIHHSTVEVNNHKGANIAGSLAGSVFYKPKLTTELAGPKARTILHTANPAIYVHMNEDPDQGGDSAASNTVTWALVRATLVKDHRVFAKVQFTQLTGNARRADGLVETTAEKLPGSWIKLTPKMPLESGEYAVAPIFKTQNTFSVVIYDFTLDPNGVNVTDAVSPAAGQ